MSPNNDKNYKGVYMKTTLVLASTAMCCIEAQCLSLTIFHLLILMSFFSLIIFRWIVFVFTNMIN